MTTRNRLNFPLLLLALSAPSAAHAASGIVANLPLLTLVTLALLVFVFAWSVRARSQLQNRLRDLEQNLAERSESEKALLAMRDEFENRLISGTEEMDRHMSELQSVRDSLDAANAQLQSTARVDPITGVANRARFDECLAAEIKRMVRERKPLSLLICSVDAIEFYRAEFGPERTDEMLAKVAALVAKTFRRAGDLVSRVGQRSFGVVMPGSDTETAGRFAKRLRQNICDLTLPFLTSPNGDRVTVSVGVTTVLPERLNEPESLVKSAMEAVEQARAAGANQVAVAQ